MESLRLVDVHSGVRKRVTVDRDRAPDAPFVVRTAEGVHLRVAVGDVDFIVRDDRRVYRPADGNPVEYVAGLGVERVEVAVARPGAEGVDQAA